MSADSIANTLDNMTNQIRVERKWTINNDIILTMLIQLTYYVDQFYNILQSISQSNLHTCKAVFFVSNFVNLLF